MTNAWHLRNDGKAFPVQIHIYTMQDDNLASEAEAAAFILKTESKDQDLAEYVLDAFMALILEHESTSTFANPTSINDAIIDCYSNKLPFHFQYRLTAEEMLKIHENQHNFYDLDSYLEFLNTVQDNLTDIQRKIQESFNQQFLRVRYGGQYFTQAGNSCIWFRVSSVGYNWNNVIYSFAAQIVEKYKIEYITICRDSEAENLEDEYFYKAKDGTVYYMMPIEDYFTEEHEKNPVFSSSSKDTAIQIISQQLAKGNTLLGAYDILERQNISCTTNYWDYLYNKDLKNDWILASEWFDMLGTSAKRKIGKLIGAVKKRFPEILGMDIDYQPRENRNGNPTGFELLCTLTSDHPKIDNVVINIAATKLFNTVTADSLVRMFTMEYMDFKKFSKIKI